MKKYLILLIISVIFCSACSKKDITECSYTGTPQEGMDVSYYYEITSNEGYVEMLKSEEVITFSSKTDAESFKSVMAKTYEPYQNLKYYDYDITLKDNTVTRKSKVNYAKIDINKVKEISNDELIGDNGKIKLDDMINVYKKIGATCKQNN